MRLSHLCRLAAALVLVTTALAGCTDGTGGPPAADASSGTRPATASPRPTPAPAPFRAAAASGPAAVVDVTDPVKAAIDTSRAIYAAAPVVVLAAADDVAAQLTGASAAVALGAPLLLVPSAPPAGATPTPDAATGVPAELARLGTEAVLAVGAVAVPFGPRVVRVPGGAGAATLAAATGQGFGAPVVVAEGGEAAAVTALGRPGTGVLAAGSPAEGPGLGSAATPGPGVTPAPALSGAGTGLAVVPRPLTPPGDVLPRTRLAPAPAATVALTGAGPVPLAVLATVRAAGLPVLDVPAADPRATSSAVEALARAKPAHVLALGAGFGPADRLAERVAAAATGVQLPGGGQLYFPQDDALTGKRYVALYGSPGMPSLGVLGEQDVPATIARAQAHAEPYRALTADAVVPGVEIIATIASAGPGTDGNYSNERPVADLLPLVQAAGDAGLTVVLDLQPGRTDFLTQAKLYQPLLELPYVSLALDPEWRLEPNQVHLKQIGHVGIDEVNAVAAWLAQLVADRHLPQKMLILHQFMLRMITDRERLDMSHDELAMVIHVDGQGGQAAKVDTWNAIRQGAPAGIHWGWKNFYDEDTPAMLDPQSTYAIQPTPDLVTYQ